MMDFSYCCDQCGKIGSRCLRLREDVQMVILQKETRIVESQTLIERQYEVNVLFRQIETMNIQILYKTIFVVRLGNYGNVPMEVSA